MYGVELARRSLVGKCCFSLGLGKVCFGAQAPRALCCCARRLSVRQSDGLLVNEQERDARGMRMLALTNVNSYGAGRVVFSEEVMEKVRPADGFLELFSLPNVCAFGRLMGSCKAADLIEQLTEARFLFEGPEHFQMD